MTNYHKQPVEAPPVVQDFLSYLVGIKNKSRNTTYIRLICAAFLFII